MPVACERGISETRNVYINCRGNKEKGDKEIELGAGAS